MNYKDSKTIQRLFIAAAIMIGCIGCNSMAASEASENHIADNQLLAFNLLQADNHQLLDDYNATVSGDTIKILIPYLIDFKLKPTFITERGAKVYVDGAKQKSAKTLSISALLCNTKCWPKAAPTPTP